MKILLKIVLLVGVLCCQTHASIIMCYYNNFSQYFHPKGLMPEDIDPSLCTHYLYAFANVRGTSLVPTDGNDINGSHMYKRFNTHFHASTKSLAKTLISIGGQFSTFKTALDSESNMVKFCVNAKNFARHYGFDGVDIDLEYPMWITNGKEKFTALLRICRKTFENDSLYLTMDKSRLLLTAALVGSYGIADKSYNVPEISKYLDIMGIMTYDFQRNKLTSHHSSLFPFEYDTGYFRNLSVSTSLNWFVNHGAPKSKLLMGIPTYGRSYTLANKNKHGFLAPATRGAKGYYSGARGVVSYFDMCRLIKLKKVTVRHEIKMGEAAYAYGDDNQWYGYDDVQSISRKVKWNEDNGIGGYLVWDLHWDDFNNFECGPVKFPLINTIKQKSQEIQDDCY